MRAGKIIGAPPADRTAQYREVVKREIDRAERLYNSGLKKVSAAVLMAIDGGECTHCGTSWKEIKVDNLFALYSYFSPACNCYPKCKRCGHLMVEDVEGGLSPDICPNCKWRLK